MPSDAYEQFLTALRENPPIPHDAPLEVRRAALERLTAQVEVPAQIDDVDAGGVPSYWVRFSEVGPTTPRAVLYLHGGAYVMGSRNTHRTQACLASKAGDARVLLIDYRRAPEHPFPAALDDAVAAYRWLLDEGFVPESIAIIGDSAGGGLTVATLLALRDAGDALSACGVCLSPWADLTHSNPSIGENDGLDPILPSGDHLAENAALYAGDTALEAPLISPVFGDLSGLPPLLIQAGTMEILRDDASELAKRAAAAGVAVELQMFGEMFHVFQAFYPLFPEAIEAADAVEGFLKAHLA